MKPYIIITIFIMANIAAYIGQTYLYQSALWQFSFITIPIHILTFFDTHVVYFFIVIA